MMGKFFIGTLLVFGGLVIAALLGSLFGAFAGWVVGWFFDETILTFFAQMGIKGLEMWQIGMSLGFLGSFFKSYSVS
jgi:hypothetical protein